MSGYSRAGFAKLRTWGRGAAVECLSWPVFARMAAVLLASTCAWGAEDVHTVPYVPSASSEGHAGLVRVESRSAVSGEVRVVAVDDAGRRAEAGVLALGARAALEFEASALESGDASLGLTGTGSGEGDWRLELTTELDIEARAYARSEGFLTALHDAALVTGNIELPFFNSGGETGRRSIVRLTNTGGEPATVTVRGVDDAGVSGGPVTVELGAWEARSYTAPELESGSAAGLTGSLGDGEGRWRLTLSAESGSAYATNLLLDESGVLSSVPGGVSRGGFHRVSLFPSASDGFGRRGMVRVVNRSLASAEVEIEAFDATDRAYERLELALGGEASGQFDSTDLEQGNAEKGLSGSTGAGEGDWWLELSSGSDIEVLSHVDTATGPQSALRGTRGTETATGMRYEALLRGESGELRLLHAGGEPMEVRVSGVDDAGSSGGEVELTLSPWSVRTLTATALEEGSEGLRGALGAGTGSWRLRLEADGELDVLSLVRGSDGMLWDVSRRGRPAGSSQRTEVIDATALGRPDLWVTASSNESEVSPGEAFDLRVTAGNGGGYGAPATTLRYYRSADAAITTGDTEVGTDAVEALAASGVSSESIALTAPSTAGMYYYGACADAVPEETNTTNNCSAAVAVTVREPPAQPDLEVRASLSASAVEPGHAFELLATVRNRGGAGAEATTLRYYRSADATITPADTEVGTDAVEALAASGVSSESIALTAPSTAGMYYYGACADAVPEETNTTNNCSAAVAVTVREPPAQPDLEVRASLSASAVEPGHAFELLATVRNRGGAGAEATTLRYYRSADATITPADTEVGTDAVEALGASGVSSESIALTAPSTAGMYYYGACADAVPEETNTTNNCSAAVAVTVREPPAQPDLEVRASLSASAVEPGHAFELLATVRNRGGAGAEATTLRYYRSADATITPADTEVGTDAVEALGASGVSSESIALTAPSTAGMYYYGACVDAVTDESDTTDNCSLVQVLTVSESQMPDLVVSDFANGEIERRCGRTVRGMRTTVSNAGPGAAPSTTLRYYRSTDRAESLDDEEIGAAEVPALEPSATWRHALEILPDSETRYYHACVDGVPGETSVDNNCSSRVEVSGFVPSGPDLIVERLNVHEYLMRLNVGALFRNVGDRPSGNLLARYYGSTDDTISTDDLVLSTRNQHLSLDPGCSTHIGEEVPRPPTGHDYLGVCVVPVAGEANTDNNCSPARRWR